MNQLYFHYKFLCKISENYIHTINQKWICLLCENELNLRISQNPIIDVYMCKSCLLKQYMNIIPQKYKLEYIEMVYKMLNEKDFEEMMMEYFQITLKKELNQ